MLRAAASLLRNNAACRVPPASSQRLLNMVTCLNKRRHDEQAYQIPTCAIRVHLVSRFTGVWYNFKDAQSDMTALAKVDDASYEGGAMGESYTDPHSSTMSTGASRDWRALNSLNH